MSGKETCLLESEGFDGSSDSESPSYRCGSQRRPGINSAMALAREGATLFISARGGDRLRTAAETIARETNATVTPVVADHGTREGREALLRACPEPDILVITCSPPRAIEDF
jgi:3-oxoacyl-[acyl-carrier protein] reductase